MSVYRGKHMWIWEVASTLSGDVQSIISLGQRLGIDGFLVKSHDGTTVLSQFSKVVKPLQQAGFMVGAWGFVYGSQPTAEAQAAQQGIDAGADWYVIDAETAYDGKAPEATVFGHALRTKNPHLVIGYAPFAFPSLHPQFPYTAFSAFCDVCLPQIYWAEFGQTVTSAFDQSIAELKPLGHPIAPIGQSFAAATAAEIEQFAVLAHQALCPGISYYDLQSASSVQLQAIKNVTVYPAPSYAHASATSGSTPATSGSTSATSGSTSATSGSTSATSGSTSTPTSAAGSSSASTTPSVTPSPSAVTRSLPVTPSDVSTSDWFYAAVTDLLKLGIVTAYQDGLFKPNETITRAQAADWINRLRIYLEKASGLPIA
ncbi:S-layer homology domain-containing protein [Ferroacidibacillus organovorans]|uniref:SLH domain-containing protein n=1 Tax=Ferroacidibacillus organovorans TaxID=1765683 RepID=A0A1V4ES91_9BACL|nr:S-layer homology domain-containing protein [Ferroacidibacillus organovorans]OPG15710.1 hypothetical protein B2M26_11705 [Ferroacidibacillus organovorans]